MSPRTRSVFSRFTPHALLSLGLLGLSLPAGAATPATFADSVDSPAGTGPRFVATGDFNKDGIPDVATANAGDRTLAILTGTATGALSAPKTVPLSPYSVIPTGLATVDIDNDGNLDVAVVGNDGGSTSAVYVHYGDGQGGFQTNRTPFDSTFSGSSFNPRRLAVGRLDEDPQYSLGLASLAFNGGGGFIQNWRLPNGGARRFIGAGASATGLVDLAVGEISGDGHDDVVLLNSDGTVIFLSGKGDSSYYDPKTYPSRPNASRVSLGDATGDGKKDIVVTGNGFLAVLPGDGNGNFGAAVVSTTTVNANALVLADFNNDQKLDAAVAPGNAPDVTVFVNQGGGTFAQPTVVSTGGNATDLAVADFNKDNKPDLIVAKEQNNAVAVFLNATMEPQPATADAAVRLTATPKLGVLQRYIQYDVKVTNNGPAPLTSATVESTLSSSLLPAESEQCTVGAQKVTCGFSSIAPGATQTRTFRVPVRLLSLRLFYTATAKRTASTPMDPNPLNDRASRGCIVFLGLVEACY